MKRFVDLTIILTLILIGVGAWTRLSHAGLGCPDWPMCYGFFLPPESGEQIAKALERFAGAVVEPDKAWIEMIHRYLASALGLFIMALAAFGWYKRIEKPVVFKLGVATFLFVIVQGLFGMWTVTLKLWPQVVTLHLLGGMLLLGLLVGYRGALSKPFLLESSSIGDSELSGAKKMFVIVLILLLIQIGLGGWLTSNYAAAACYDFPTCQGVWWPYQDYSAGFNIFQSIGPNYLGGQIDHPAKTAIHMAHRLGALVLFTVSIVVLIFWCRRIQVLRLYSVILMLVLGIQVALGVGNIWLNLPLHLAVAHNMMAAMLLALWVNVGVFIWMQSK